MDSDITGTILSVLGRPTSTGKTIYDIAFSDGNTYTTFDGQIAGKAQALQGQQVSARVKIAPNPKKPQYTNFYFNDVAPQGQLPPQAQPVAAGAPVQIAPVQVAAAPVAQIPMQSVPSQAEKDARITLQAMTKVAGRIVGSLFTGAGPDALAEAEEATKKLATSLFGFITGNKSESAPVAAQTPEAVAAEINSEVAGAVTVGAPSEEAVLPWMQ